MKKYNCEKCEDAGFYEVDPLSPEEADTPQYETCICCLENNNDVDMSGASGEGER